MPRVIFNIYKIDLSNKLLFLLTITMSTTLYNMNIDGCDKFFIHFSSKEECDRFKTEFNGTIGHTCCSGKGVHVKTYNGLAVDSDKIYNNIKKKYNTS
jgi:hypothetical protein